MERNWSVSAQSQSMIFQFQTKIWAAVFKKGQFTLENAVTIESLCQLLCGPVSSHLQLFIRT